MPISFGRNVLGETFWAKRFGRKFWAKVFFLEPYFEFAVVREGSTLRFRLERIGYLNIASYAYSCMVGVG